MPLMASHQSGDQSIQKALALSQESAELLKQYTACDISDALLKLAVPGAGYLPDLSPHSQLSAEAGAGAGAGDAGPATVTVALASTVLFAPKGQTPTSPQRNIPSDQHWVDLTPKGTFVIMQQPEGQHNAICGGIMAARMKVLGAAGVAVAGRVRDLAELRGTGLPIWSRGVSTVGAGAQSIPWAVQVPLHIGDSVVRPGDVVFSDTENGLVVIPAELLGQVLELLPRLTAADDKVREAVVGQGMSVREAFRLHRGNL